MIEITDIIERLIDQRAEGVYWDYKEQHHTCKYDLVHDMLCLANAKHQGPRYLIFGVSDSGVVRSIRKDRGRRTQADVADLFRSNASKFADQTFPEFYMAYVKVRNQYVDVLVIEDRPHKPYYLIEQYGKIKPHHIYTRVCDTNTPAGESAAPREIERMYMERAGLGVSLADRIKKYLRDVPNWTTALTDHQNEEVWYYRPFPEITMRSAAASEDTAHNEEWTRGEVRRDDNMARYQEIWCHQTCIARVRCVTFDDRKKHMVAPAWEPMGLGRFYYYEMGSMELALQKHLVEREGGVDDSKTLSIGRLHDEELECEIGSRFGRWLSIPVLQASELREFLDVVGADSEVEPSSEGVDQYRLFVENLLKYDKWCQN